MNKLYNLLGNSLFGVFRISATITVGFAILCLIQSLAISIPLHAWESKILLFLISASAASLNFSWIDKSQTENSLGLIPSAALALLPISYVFFFIAVFWSSLNLFILSLFICAMGWLLFALQDKE